MASLGKQLMDFIDEEILIFGRHADHKGQYADWSSSAEAKINEFLEEATKPAIVRWAESVCDDKFDPSDPNKDYSKETKDGN